MKKTFTQKKGNTTYTFTIDESGLSKKISKRHGETEIHSNFETITENKKIFLKHDIIYLVLAYGTFAIGGLSLVGYLTEENFSIIPPIILLTATPIFLFLYYSQKTWILHLYKSDAHAIEFYTEKKEQEELSDFIKQLILERNQYLEYKYTQLSKFIDYGRQLENLNWLLTIKAISKEKFEAKRTELNDLFKNERGKNTIGF